jgi:hypothetical protein
MYASFSRLDWVVPRFLPIAGAAFLLLANAAFLRADPELTPEVQDRINQAIDKGVVFLRKTQNPTGTWAADKGPHTVGYAALPALTLLECGVSAKEPAIQWAAIFVRKNATNLDTTYELALSILLLDRLGDKRDRPMIEMMSLRLMAGQTATGGWAYRCPLLDAANHKSLLAYLKMKKLAPDKVPAYWRNLPIFQEPGTWVMVDPKEKRQERMGGTTDNSNSQFAMLALWTARRQGVPVDRSLKLIVRRFETSQNLDGSWGYDYKFDGGLTGSPAMNCVGLLGLAIGHGLAYDKAEMSKTIALQPREVAALVMSPSPFMLGQILDRDFQARLARDKARRETKDPKILTGFVALDKHIGQPTGKLENLPKANLYFLWSVERVAVLYNLKKLGKKDWYLWGAEVLVANQNADGHWQDGGYHGASSTADTCLALLFLKRANFAADLATALPFNPDTLTQDVLGRIVAETPVALPLPDPVITDDSDKKRPPKVGEMTTDKPSPDLQNPLRNATETPLLEAVPDKSFPFIPVIALVLVLGLVGVGGVLWLFPFLLIRKKDEEEDEEASDRKNKKRKRNGSSVRK